MYKLDSMEESWSLSTPPYVYPGIWEIFLQLLTAKIFYSHKIFYFLQLFPSNKVSTRGFSDLFMA